MKPSTIASFAKVSLLAIASAVLVWMGFVAVLASDWIIAITLGLILVFANWVYFSKKSVAGKFLFPGSVLLVIFVVVPIIYTAWMSVYNYKTGNEITKDQAITQLHQVGLVPDESGTTYDMVLGKYAGKDAVLLTDQTTHAVAVGTADNFLPLPEGTFTTNAQKVATTADGFTTATPAQVADASSWLTSFVVPQGSGKFVSRRFCCSWFPWMC
ncbi:MAG: hypothetical protein ACKOUD_00865 [Rhodoluna sp.]